MASMPGMPGPLGLPSGTPQGSDVVDPNFGAASSSIIVNRTVWHHNTVGDFGSITIPATTEGNCLVIVQMSQWWMSFPTFNGIMAGYPRGSTQPSPVTNTPEVGVSGFEGDFPHGVNTGSAIAYFTNIAGNVTQISYVFDPYAPDPVGTSGGYIPTIGIVYELVPCVFYDIFGTAMADQPDLRTSAPNLLTFPVDGPDSFGLYISTVVYNYDGVVSSLSGSFDDMDAPWALDYQEVWNDPTHIYDIAVATAILNDTTGFNSGRQQATFKWGGTNVGASDAYGTATIALLPTRPSGGTTGSADEFNLPNTWVIS